MPLVVDHEVRRVQLAETAARLVASGGEEAATVRAVAKSTGYSTKVVSHYFENKRALLLATYRFAALRAASIAEATQTSAVADAGAYAKALLPVDSAQRENWLVWYAFWARAITDEDFAREQRVQVNDTRNRIARLLRQDPRYPGIKLSTARNAARCALTEVIGIALQAIFDRRYWTRARQEAAVEKRLRAACVNSAT